MNLLRKLLIRDPKCYPFGDHFDIDYIYNSLKEFSTTAEGTDEEKKLANTLATAVLLSPNYKDTFDYIKKVLFESNLSTKQVISYCLALANRDLIIVLGTMSKKYEEKEIHRFEEAYGIKIQSSEKSSGNINPQSALEGHIDALNLLFNYTNYFKEQLKESIETTDLQKIEFIKRLNIASSFFTALKTVYDNCIWNNGYSDFSETDKIFSFHKFNPNDLVLKAIGFFRFRRNSHGSYLQALDILENAKATHELFGKNKRAKRIKNVSVSEGSINYNLADGIDKNEIDWEFYRYSSFITYYNFIEDVKLPNLENLSLSDLLTMFDTLQHLFRKTHETAIEDRGVFLLTDFDRYPYRIKIENLKSYMLSRTTYSRKQINQFLELLTNKENKRINFWDYPLLADGQFFLFPLISIVHPVILVLTDRWLEDGGFNIDKRGKYLEADIKATLQKELAVKKYNFFIPPQTIFRLPNGEYEEIDLIVNLKSICIVAEVKCIKYPLQPRDEHNALNRLQIGANQVKRKTQFLLDNIETFNDVLGDIKNKPVINLVITNYPLFAGYQFNEVPVIDFFLLEAYISSGKITSKKYTTYQGKRQKEETVSETVFYTNEDEFCNNLLNHMMYPPAIEEIKEFIEFKPVKISLDFMEYQIFVDDADFKEN